MKGLGFLHNLADALGLASWDLQVALSIEGPVTGKRAACLATCVTHRRAHETRRLKDSISESAAAAYEGFTMVR